MCLGKDSDINDPITQILLVGNVKGILERQMSREESYVMIWKQ